MIILNPGTQVYYVIHRQRIVVSAVIDECNEFYNINDLNYQVARYLNGSVEVYIPDNSSDEFKFHRRDPVELKGYQPCSQFFWIDEPVGHSVLLGEDIFLTLNEAFKVVRPSSPRHLKRRHKEWRTMMKNFILGTWKAAKHNSCSLPKYSSKKIYVRRK